MNKKFTGDIYAEYYLNQAGSGYSNVYAGPVYQKGYGIGSFLGGLFRSAFPLLKKGASAVGNELLKSGKNILFDIARSEDPQQVIKKRGKETIENISRLASERMFGSGYNYEPMTTHVHSHSSRAVKRKTKSNNSKAAKKTVKKSAKKPAKKTRNNKKTLKRDKSDIFDLL